MAQNDNNDRPNPERRRPPERPGMPGGGGGFNRNNNDDDDNNFSRSMRTALVWMSILGGTLLILFFFNSSQQGQSRISYNEYQRLISEGRVKTATIENQGLNSYLFIGKLKGQTRVNFGEGVAHEISSFNVPLAYVNSETEEWWRSNGVEWTYSNNSNSIWDTLLTFLPFILLIAIFMVVMRRMQNGNSRGIFTFGKSRARLINDTGKKVTFEDVAGADEAKYELEEIIEFLRNPEKFQKLGGKIPRGVLLLGPPGTGKTLLARAVAGEANVPFFSISGADFVEMFVGVGASRVRDLFEQAKKNHPCIIFIDEIDAVGRHRGTGLGGGHDEREQTLNQLLVEMDGFEQNSGVIVVAATNRPDVLDPALLRPGRFDRQVVVDRPDVRGRLGILKVHTKKIPMDQSVNLEVIAAGTPGLSGADLANLVNEAALLAARYGCDAVNMELIDEAKDKILMGVKRQSMVITDDEKLTTAYHEMGHALVGMLVKDSDPVHKVTIIPRGRALGLTSYLPSEQLHTMSKERIEVRIVALLAGRAAEKLVFNKLNTGAMNDLERATMLARKMVCEWGMSDTLGPVFYSNNDEEPFLGRELSHSKHISEETARAIDAEVRSIMQAGMEKAETLLRENMDLLHKTSQLLVERESLDSSELKLIMEGKELPPKAVSLHAVGSKAGKTEAAGEATAAADGDTRRRRFASTLKSTIKSKEKSGSGEEVEKGKVEGSRGDADASAEGA